VQRTGALQTWISVTCPVADVVETDLDQRVTCSVADVAEAQDVTSASRTAARGYLLNVNW
jgi:hypothetical protein